jgi:hypothetical protein
MVREEPDSRFRGNDVTFDRSRRGTSLCLQEDYRRKNQSEIPRFALSKITALSPLGERVARCWRFHQPERAG